MFLPSASLLISHMAHFYQSENGFESLLLGHGHAAKFRLLSFTPWEIRNERRSQDAPWPHQLLPQASCCLQRRGCRHSPGTTLSEWPSSRNGKAAVRLLVPPTLEKLHQTPWALRHELQCVLSVHFHDPSLLWDELHLEDWRVSSLVRVLQDRHCTYFLCVHYMLGTGLFILKALLLWARTVRSLRLSEMNKSRVTLLV